MLSTPRISDHETQSHFIVGEVPTTIVQSMEAFTALGVEVAITELDIRMTLPQTTQSANQQATDYGTVIKQCASVSKCIGVTVWDFTDKYSWVPNTFSGQGNACIWDSVSYFLHRMTLTLAYILLKNLQKKTAVYNAIISAF